MSYSHLSSAERRVIFHCFTYGVTRAEIARRLGRHRSTISREIKRGARRYGPRYDGIYAHEQALAKRRTARHRRRVDNAQLVRYVQKKLCAHWRPEAIAGRLPIAFPDRPDMRISHEQIEACCTAISDAAMSIDGGDADCRSSVHAFRIASISANARPLWIRGHALVTGKAIRCWGARIAA